MQRLAMVMHRGDMTIPYYDPERKGFFFMYCHGRKDKVLPYKQVKHDVYEALQAEKSHLTYQTHVKSWRKKAHIIINRKLLAYLSKHFHKK